MADESTPPPLPSQPVVIAPASRTEPLAIISLVLAILSWIVCLLIGSIPAIICGHMARSKIRRSNGALTGMNFALAGLIIAYLEIPMGIMGGIMLVDMIRSDRVRLHDLALEKKEIISDDTRSKITVSGFWVKRSDLNKHSSLQAAKPDKELYLIVIGDSKTKVPNMTLQQHHQTTRDHMLKQLNNSSATDPVSTTIDNHPALQDELRGTENGKNVVFLHTTVDEGDSFEQILAWTEKGRWASENQELHNATSSFHIGE
ncbi:MAG TPA: DUF4190 domain-containing protein [Chthoniobacterales bacterium]|nr:DUF4190 domain-containing protein [Chthoniobacterales bacterium]